MAKYQILSTPVFDGNVSTMRVKFIKDDDSEIVQNYFVGSNDPDVIVSALTSATRSLPSATSPKTIVSDKLVVNEIVDCKIVAEVVAEEPIEP